MKKRITQLIETDSTSLTVLREAAGIALWVYTVLKLLAFDVNLYVLDWLAPDLSFLVHAPLVISLIGVSLLWVIFGYREAAGFLIYVIGYPLILFGRVSKCAERLWPSLIHFGRTLRSVIVRSRETLLLYSLGALSAIVILLADQAVTLIPAMLGLGLFFLVHLWRSLRQAWVPTTLSKIAWVIGIIRKAIAERAAENAFGGKSTSDPLLPIFHAIHPYVVRTADWVHAHRRLYDLYLIACWLYTVGLTVLVYGLGYLALHKIDPGAFLSAEKASFWSFLGFSIDILATANISRISPASDMAQVLCYSQLGCGPIILVILAFVILTAARETFQDDIRQFTSELRLLAEALEK